MVTKEEMRRSRFVWKPGDLRIVKPKIWKEFYTMLAEPECFKRRCKHFEGVKYLGEGEETEVVYCKAFPNGIPTEIAYGKNKHTKVHEDQKNKIIFKYKNAGLKAPAGLAFLIFKEIQDFIY